MLYRVAATTLIALFLLGCSDHEHAQGHKHAQGYGHSYGGHVYAVEGPDGKKAAITIVAVSMRDSGSFEFSPPFESLTGGGNVEFVITNVGKQPHEFSIGNSFNQMKHSGAMQQITNMQQSHSYAVAVKPGETASFRWTVSTNDTVVCSRAISSANLPRVCILSSR